MLSAFCACAERALQVRYGRERAEVQRFRLLHVQLRLVAALEQPLGDLETALLQGGVLVCDAQPQLEGADGRVEAGGLRRHQHLHVIVLGDAREVGRIRRFDPAPELAPEVHLPGDVERRAVAVVRLARDVRRVLPDPERLAAQLLQLGIESTPGNAELRARLHDPRAGNTHARVRALRLGHHLIERRVVEDQPPRIVRHLRGRRRKRLSQLG